MMFTTSDMFYLALFFTALGILIGTGIALWSRSRRKANFTAPYHRFNGDPQPGPWYPGRAQAQSSRHRIDVWARETGAV
jgi:hypothetical protein